ncbi:decaprenyl-phosphate phosphoribosyltransferase [Candidatus Microgenomates bacterium]|nr:MAG: decaprenyl-phosphate phosphoribosyltransferase [Candidatus Microgenomates bacterium]
MKKRLFDIFRLLRPRQWLKNLAIFAAATFTGGLFDGAILQKTLLGFIIFCGVSSAIYIINDIFDIEKDRMHPFKKFRPLATRDVSIVTALFLSFFLIFFSLFFSPLVAPAFLVLIIIYLFLQLSYSLFLKNIAVLDIIILAAGYILRVYGGEVATGFHISVWLLLTTISLSLFLAVGKRRSELTLISDFTGEQIKKTRKSLSHYSERLLDVYASIFATSTFISYALFTFLENPVGFKLSLGVLMPDFLPSFFQRKWLMLTIIPVVYGLMRYMQDIYEKHEGESPEKVLLSDKPLLFTVLLWTFMVIIIIYFIGP